MRNPVGKLVLSLSIAGLLTACGTPYKRVSPSIPVDVDAGGRALQAKNVLVLNYLVTKSVFPYRLSAKGYGLDRTTADNDTRIGRSNNRRVQFAWVE